jgi:hypothetical protein
MPNKNYPMQMITVREKDIPFYRVNSDINGNARYVAHFLDLGVEPEHYGKITGLTKYRAKWFCGGYVFQSCHLESTLDWALETVENFYNREEDQ